MKERSGMPYDVVAFSTDEEACQWTNQQEGAFHRLMRSSWINGGIPDDMKKIAVICREPLRIMVLIWPVLESKWPIDPMRPDRRVNPKQECEREFKDKKSDKAAESAARRWELERAAKAQAKAVLPSTPDAMRTHSDGTAPLPSPPRPIPKEEKRKKGEGELPKAEKQPRPVDPACEHFSAKCLELTAVPYVPKSGDFVNLAKLRQAYGIGTRDTPPGWETAVLNYFASPLGSWTLADLVVRYAMFHNSPTDRFNKPINHNGGSHAARETDNDKNNRAIEDFIARSMAPEVRSDVSDVREEPERLPGQVRLIS